MRNVDFYALSAQVLPALAIALVLQRWSTFVGYGMSRLSGSRQSLVFRSMPLAILLAVFALGETAAMLVVFMGTEGPLPLVAGPVIWLTLLTLLVAMFISAFTRVRLREPQ
ncbi:hypothetical protein ABT214_17460 [Micromonospora purpureochromogenes]|uniref:hypothetical protein n=1 Tax=Micromonospora TaxID=1873 RepID=UPI001B399702|nr:hypothetical protein [Micromonospora sp. U56]MBQ0897174.1 hypothetical protein [Micromonospora sp. U56]